MTTIAAPRRVESETLAKLETKGGVKGREPWELQDRLGRNRLVEIIINKFSGQGANTTEEFQNYQALIRGINGLGMANGAELKVLKEKAFTSGDLQGKNKLQIIQLLEEKGILIPGGANAYPTIQEEKPGFVQRVKNVIWPGGQ